MQDADRAADAAAARAQAKMAEADLRAKMAEAQTAAVFARIVAANMRTSPRTDQWGVEKFDLVARTVDAYVRRLADDLRALARERENR